MWLPSGEEIPTFLIGGAFTSMAIAGAIRGLSELCPVVWKFLDDGDTEIISPISKLLAKCCGFTKVRPCSKGVYKYGGHKVLSNTDDLGGYNALYLFVPLVFPALYCLLVLAPWLPILLALATTLAFTARYVRRLAKRFKLHLVDPNAHKIEDNEV